MSSLNRILLLDALALLIIVIVSHNQAFAQQLDGGVFNSPEAQKYWNRRLGKDTLDLARKAAKKFAAAQFVTRPDLIDETTFPAETTTLEDDNQIATTTLPMRVAPYQRVIYVPRFFGTYGNPSPLWTTWAKTSSVP